MTVFAVATLLVKMKIVKYTICQGALQLERMRSVKNLMKAVNLVVENSLINLVQQELYISFLRKGVQ